MRLGILKIDDIDPGTRARKDYKDLGHMATSIKEKGLIHPIAVSLHPDVAGKYILAAGGRRLAAFKLLGREEIPCRIYDRILNPLELKSIELIENIHREDLSYSEKIFLQKEIYELQIAIHGRKISTNPDAQGISMRDVAEMIGISHAKLSEDLSLADTMELLPDVPWDNFKNRQEALKFKDTLKKHVIVTDKAEAIKKELGTGSTFKNNVINSYIVGDFFEKVKEIPDGVADICEVDPPYGVSLDKVKKRDGDGIWSYGEGGYNEVNQSSYLDFMEAVLKECYRILKSDGWLVCWYGSEWHHYIFTLIKNQGFKLSPIPAIWAKGEEEDGIVTAKAGQANQPGMYLASSYENFFYARKGNPIINRQGRSNMFSHKPTPPQHKIHPTERPIDLISDILTTFCTKGSRVIVPFAGSGITMIAAYLNEMVATGFDLTSGYKDGYIIKVEQLIK